ncbi:MAG TPA: ribosome biogenesis GTP-binding protein YihA/YsxC [Terriglobales bacterium]|nr:ribosome biogenesis GTP-binding protein YihA/YsxC [Terriglobales bacterium]
MKVLTKFLTSVVDPALFPEPSVPEVAFAGRSNVGKSSLLNALAGAKVAHVSSTPGRTRTINFFQVNFEPKRQLPDLVLVDLPGYGYAKISRSISAEWPKFIEPYLRERETLALCVCLVDASIPPQLSDQQLITWLRQHQRPFLVVGTKADRLTGNKIRKSLADLQVAHEVEHILPVSAEKGAGLKELWQEIRGAATPL